MTPLAAYLLLFLAVGVGFILVHLLLGKLIRPDRPHAEKGTIYECGEPTIGSAWVQFDLRFYVVALLFVIFDVEVAFFFPWAEVFGKANAIVSAPTPQTAEQYQDFANKVLELAGPQGRNVDLDTPPSQFEPEAVVQGRLWKTIARITPEELELIRGLDEGQRAFLRSLRPAPFQGLTLLDKETVSRFAAPGDRLTKLFDQFTQQRKQAIETFLAALKQLPEKSRTKLDLTKLEKELPAESSLPERTFSALSLEELIARPRGELNLGNTSLPRDVRKLAPGPVKELSTLATDQQQRLTAEVNQVNKEVAEILAPLIAKHPEQKTDIVALGRNLSPAALVSLPKLNENQVNALSRLTPAMVRAMEVKEEGTAKSIRGVQETRKAASSLAWLALIEILVFFGVILVGFAYLWRRGDLAWVRSVQAERSEPVTAHNTPPLPPEQPLELEVAAAGKH